MGNMKKALVILLQFWLFQACNLLLLPLPAYSVVMKTMKHASAGVYAGNILMAVIVATAVIGSLLIVRRLSAVCPPPSSENV